MLCMGHTFTVTCPFQLSCSWESTPACVKASGRGAKCYPREDYSVYSFKTFVSFSELLILHPLELWQHRTGPVKQPMDRVFKTVIIIYLEYAKVSHLFFFLRIFFTSKQYA
jgi:hypothetical protein